MKHRRLWITLTGAAAAVLFTCQALFPPFEHFLTRIQVLTALAAGWLLRMAWVKGRRP